MLGKAFWSYSLPRPVDTAKGQRDLVPTVGSRPTLCASDEGPSLPQLRCFGAVPLDDLHQSVAMTRIVEPVPTRRSAGLRGRNPLRLRCDGHLLPFRRAFHGEGRRGSARDHLAHFIEVFRPDERLVLDRGIPFLSSSELSVLQFRV